ncbi:hypothetical protein O181_017778 [Austropuccinia psidii MF-1]|uniref:Phosducin thioredoxin-like domain-containing protein n=1 Tax=Austropuccinia psidii MF-1 TaxID=1389203 RepID=A0A9Q3C7R9_9BASI|nr:hypothetical protein [Austropuccinia psidii MF-1]
MASLCVWVLRKGLSIVFKKAIDRETKETMNSLEQAALSGLLTNNLHLADQYDPEDNQEIMRIKHDDDDDDGDNDMISFESHSQDVDNGNVNDNDNKSQTGQSNGLMGHHHNKSDGHHGSLNMSRGWSGNTGPKGVLVDFKASHGKSGAILGGDNSIIHHSLNHHRQLSTPSGYRSKKSLSSNSNRYTTRSSGPDSSSSDRDDHDSYHPTSFNSAFHHSSGRLTTRLTISPQRRKTHSTSIATSPLLHNPKVKLDSKGKKLFGHLREVGVENFVQAVEAEKDDQDIIVLVHLYDPALESCVILNSHLSNLARIYPRTKFLRALASELDFFNTIPPINYACLPSSPQSVSRSPLEINTLLHSNHLFDDLLGDDSSEEHRPGRATDNDVLPTLIWYRAGEYVQSLPALERELPSGMIDKGEKGYEELQRLLRTHGIIGPLKS